MKARICIDVEMPTRKDEVINALKNLGYDYLRGAFKEGDIDSAKLNLYLDYENVEGYNFSDTPEVNK